MCTVPVVVSHSSIKLFLAFPHVLYVLCIGAVISLESGGVATEVKAGACVHEMCGCDECCMSVKKPVILAPGKL